MLQISQDPERLAKMFCLPQPSGIGHYLMDPGASMEDKGVALVSFPLELGVEPEQHRLLLRYQRKGGNVLFTDLDRVLCPQHLPDGSEIVAVAVAKTVRP